LLGTGIFLKLLNKQNKGRREGV